MTWIDVARFGTCGRPPGMETAYSCITMTIILSISLRPVSSAVGSQPHVPFPERFPGPIAVADIRVDDSKLYQQMVRVDALLVILSSHSFA